MKNYFGNWFFMFNKKANFKNKNVFKRCAALALASAMSLSSSLALPTLNKAEASTVNSRSSSNLRRYFDDSDVSTQTRIMMNGNNTLNNKYWMQAEIDQPADIKLSGYDVTLTFTIPGYDASNLLLFVRSRASTDMAFTEHRFASSTKELFLSNLTAGGYEVHVYNGSLAEKNFICKADFECLPSTPDLSTNAVNLLNASGSQFTQNGASYTLGYNVPDNSTNPNMFLLAFPTEIIPYDCDTIKVAFFASENFRGNAPLNVDHILYDYVKFVEEDESSSSYLYFLVDAQWGTNPNLTYEAHFYKNSIAPENFICKAVNIPTVEQTAP